MTIIHNHTPQATILFQDLPVGDIFRVFGSNNSSIPYVKCLRDNLECCMNLENYIISDCGGAVRVLPATDATLTLLWKMS